MLIRAIIKLHELIQWQCPSLSMLIIQADVDGDASEIDRNR